jgi:hypothetical protein
MMKISFRFSDFSFSDRIGFCGWLEIPRWQEAEHYDLASPQPGSPGFPAGQVGQPFDGW